MDTSHQRLRLTGAWKRTIRTGTAVTQTRKRADRTIDEPDDRADSYPIWRNAEIETALGSTLAGEDTGILEFIQNRLEKSGRSVHCAGNPRGEDRPAAVFACQEIERTQSVLAFSGQGSHLRASVPL